MEKQYKLSSVNWAIFRDGKVLPFIINTQNNKIRVLGRRLDVEYVIDTIESESFLECAYRKLESLRRCACFRKNNKSSIASNNYATKDEILDIASKYETIIKNNIKLQQTKESEQFSDETSRTF